ncbi:hypothetical protein FRC98_10395 [Lujinxingia vulgaris]|uniref:Uncharacterized protein n=1 Tax=Lujinxingia vulgaris TaxID=2600176 RepID=A0A5C6X9S0_9DELT|nr:hypothetical protein [Lujinxingia vulgaris]TXD37136.1 hypothetical protein FRC98_10395 [Lujinxingia vulgaris]
MRQVKLWGGVGMFKGAFWAGALTAATFWAVGALSRPALAAEPAARPPSAADAGTTRLAETSPTLAHSSPQITRWPGPVELREVNQARLNRQARGMSVLLAWSALNIGVGTAGYFVSDGPQRYFHQMNAAWNLVNAAIAGFGLRGALRADAASFDGLQTLEEGRSFERVLAINIGLNVAYMASGAFMWERGLRRDDERLLGYGPSLVLQGAFLLVFDSTLFALQQRASARFLDGVQVGATADGGLQLGYGARF